jgi:hypothetical protein
MSSFKATLGKTIVGILCAGAMLVPPAQTQPGTAAPKLAPIDRLTQQLTKAGVKRCLPIVQAVGKFLIENGEAAFIVKSLGANGDTSPVMVTTESSHRSLGTTRYSTLTVVPAESCAGYYEQSIYWAQACAAVRTTNFANFPPPKALQKNILTSAASPTVSLYLMPAGQGCVSIKKEIFR